MLRPGAPHIPGIPPHQVQHRPPGPMDGMRPPSHMQHDPNMPPRMAPPGMGMPPNMQQPFGQEFPPGYV